MKLRSLSYFAAAYSGATLQVRKKSRILASLAIGFGVSSFVVALIGPAVKDAGFPVLLSVLAGVAFCSFVALSMLPSESDVHAASAAPKPAE